MATRDHLRIGDMAAGTLLVYERAGRTGAAGGETSRRQPARRRRSGDHRRTAGALADAQHRGARAARASGCWRVSHASARHAQPHSRTMTPACTRSCRCCCAGRALHERVRAPAGADGKFHAACGAVARGAGALPASRPGNDRGCRRTRRAWRTITGCWRTTSRAPAGCCPTRAPVSIWKPRTPARTPPCTTAPGARAQRS